MRGMEDIKFAWKKFIGPENFDSKTQIRFNMLYTVHIAS
jgi:hypothetical protein